MKWLVKPVRPLDDRDPGGGGSCECYGDPCEDYVCSRGPSGCLCGIAHDCLEVSYGLVQIPE